MSVSKNMVDVILFFPKTGMDSMVQLPLSVLCVASTLTNYELSLIDERIESDALKQVEKKSASAICVGVSVMTGRQISYGLRASKVAHGNARVVWGGIHPTLEPGQTLNNKNVDVVVRGEGELTFLDVVKSLEAGSDLSRIDGIGFKERNGKQILTKDRKFVDLNALPETPYDLVNVEKYITQREGFRRCLTLQTSRGCPHDCTFCINPVYNRRQWRSLAAERMVARTVRLKERFKLDGIIYQEDNFFADMRRVEDFCRIIQEKNVDIRWKANCRISYLARKNKRFYDMLEKAGCKLLQFGVESGSDRILKILRKHTTTQQILEVNRKLAETRIECRYNFIVGIPTETIEEIQTTLKFIEVLKRDNPNLKSSFVNIYTPWPGTELYAKSIQEGFISPRKLEEWAQFNWNDALMPWIDKKTARFMRRVSSRYLTKSKFFKPNL